MSLKETGYGENPISLATLSEAITATLYLSGVENPFGSLQVWKWTGVTIKAISNVHECQTPHTQKKLQEK